MNKPQEQFVFQPSDWDWLKGKDERKSVFIPEIKTKCSQCKNIEERLITLLKKLEEIK
jgi:hypothetical protein